MTEPPNEIPKAKWVQYRERMDESIDECSISFGVADSLEVIALALASLTHFVTEGRISPRSTR